jgi:hypothetical protein
LGNHDLLQHRLGQCLQLHVRLHDLVRWWCKVVYLHRIHICSTISSNMHNVSNIEY